MTAFDERLRALRQRFVEKAAVDATEIEDRAAAMAWDAVRDLSHGMVGRAGMFGFPALTDAAQMLERAIDEGRAPDQIQLLAKSLVSRLRELSTGPAV